jgi:hypothetical protein
MAQPISKSKLKRGRLSPWDDQGPPKFLVSFIVVGDDDDENEMSFNLYLQKTVKIVDIKQKIQEDIRIPMEHQTLMLNNEEVGPERTLESLNIEEHGFISFKLVVASFNIIVYKLPSDGVGDGLWIDVKSTDTIGHLKAKIQEVHRSSGLNQILMFDGEELDDDKLVSSYSIEENSILYIKANTKFQIYVSTLAGEINITLDVEASNTISSVKALIKSKRGTPPAQQELYFGLTMLEDARTLSDYNVDRESQAIVSLVTLPVLVKIDCVRASRGSSFEPKVSASHTVDDVKTMIREHHGWSDGFDFPLKKVDGNIAVTVSGNTTLGELNCMEDSWTTFFYDDKSFGVFL